MNNIKKEKLIFWLLILVTIFGLFSCAPSEKPQPLPPRISEKLKTIVVIPFDYHCPTSTPLPFYCPVQGIIPGEVKLNAREVMNQLLRNELSAYSGKYNFIFLSQNEFESLLEEGLSKAKSFSELVHFIATKTEAQGVLYGKIFRFKERRGSSWSVEEPASVAFVLILYDGETGKILWQGVFDETQKPLSENILNLALYGKVKWLTAKELAERGLKRILKTFP